MAFFRVMALYWADMLTAYVMWIMPTYLVNIWHMKCNDAAKTMNVANGLANILPFFFALFVDSGFGNYLMLLLSSISYVIGLGFLSLSAPKVLNHASGTTIGQKQKALFYTALLFIAAGKSGHLVSLVAFLVAQFENKQDDTKEDKSKSRLLSCNCFPFSCNTSKPNDGAKDVDVSKVQSLQFQPVEAMRVFATTAKRKIAGLCILVYVPFFGLIALPYITSWSLRFGIPAIITLVATLFFWLSSRGYKDIISKEEEQATVNNNRSWMLCRVTDAEERKTIVRMIPIWITFIICGIVISIGSTYFVEQANRMNYKIGVLRLPNSIFLVLYEIAKIGYSILYTVMAKCLLRVTGLQKYGPSVGILLATICSVLCCIVAALVETRRINVIRDKGLLDKPGEKIPMSVLWLLPQYMLLAGLDSFYGNSASQFLNDQSPPSVKKYLVHIDPLFSGLGYIGSIILVLVIQGVSQSRGKQNWFQDTLNHSRLDYYYWTLAVLSAANFFWFLVAALKYPYREAPIDDKGKTAKEKLKECMRCLMFKCCCR